MKKLLSAVLSATMLLSAMGVTTLAASYLATEAEPIKITVKKADAADVVKDGKIGENEYEKFVFPSDTDDNQNPVPMTLVYGNDPDMYDYAENMSKTMEYYFSWDETHGFNFAVRFQPAIELVQGFKQGEGEKPGDEFMRSYGLQIEFDQAVTREEYGGLYYAVSKNFATNEYLKGHYNQLGLTGAYNPEGGKDFEVSYDRNSGYITYEWSIPFEHYSPDAKAGSDIFFTMCATCGTESEEGESSYQEIFGVSIGGFAFLADQKDAKNVTATLSSEEIKPAVPDNPFTDLVEGSFYYDPVLWAVGKKITDGTTPTTFEPEKTCTRGQIVTFLWRALGSPEPKSTTNPFGDVKSGSYYYKPVLWAVENKVTNGVEEDKFGPDANVTRGQTVTFLWRAAGEEKATATNPFKDVASGEFYTDAVLWAVNKNITNGTSANEFSPQNECTRAQIVTFLNRFDSNK